LSFGYPLHPEALVDGQAISWFIPPPGFGSDDALRLATGELSPEVFHALVNHTAVAEFAEARERFPKACLLMQLGEPRPSKSLVPQQPDRYFILWKQNGQGVELIDLPRTDNPHQAADFSVQEHGCDPTIFRSTCGNLVAFKNTHGGAFL
jgi:hypothetical protein